MSNPCLRSPRQHDCSRHPRACGYKAVVCAGSQAAEPSQTPLSSVFDESCYESGAWSLWEVLSVGGELCTPSHPKGAKEGLELRWDMQEVQEQASSVRF